jgi:hypothetical protein
MFGAVWTRAISSTPAAAAAITEKDILKDGQPTTISNYCSNADKKPNKFCPNHKEGHCKECNFFNKDNSLGDYKGGKYARCMLLTEPGKPQFVSEKGWCATFTKKT